MTTGDDIFSFMTMPLLAETKYHTVHRKQVYLFFQTFYCNNNSTNYDTMIHFFPQTA